MNEWNMNYEKKFLGSLFWSLRVWYAYVNMWVLGDSWGDSNNKYAGPILQSHIEEKSTNLFTSLDFITIQV